MDYERYLSIGKIVGAHGIKGLVKVFSYAESASRYKTGLTIYLKDLSGKENPLKVIWTKPHSKFILLSLEGIINRNKAEELIGSEIYIDKSVLDEQEEGTYFWADLVGLSVFKIDGTYIGKLTSIIQTGSNDVYVVTDTDGDKFNEVLIPALEWVVKEVNIAEGVMHVALPDGL